MHSSEVTDRHTDDFKPMPLLLETGGVLVSSSLPRIFPASSSKVGSDRRPLTLNRVSGIDSVRRCFAPLGGSYTSSRFYQLSSLEQ